MTAHMIGAVGIQGHGKSHFLRSATVVGKTAVALADPKEVTFYAVDGPASADFNPANLVTVDLFHDFDWRPHKGQDGRQASGYKDLLAWLEAREKDDSEFIVFDTFTEISRLAQHEYLKLQGVFNPSDLEYGRGYTGVDILVQALMTEMRRLHAQGKTILASFHARMKEYEGSGEAQKKRAMSGDVEWRFDEQMLPVVEGTNAGAQNIGAPFDLWLYMKPSGSGPGRKYWLTSIADSVRPAKHSVIFKDGVNKGMIPNTMQALLEALV